MEAEANIPIKTALIPKIDHLEQSDLPANKEECAEVDFDKEDEDYLPNPIKEKRLIRFKSKRSSAICVYTYKVKYTSFVFHFFLIFLAFCILIRGYIEKNQTPGGLQDYLIKWAKG